jgi:hypothetical protein
MQWNVRRQSGEVMSCVRTYSPEGKPPARTEASCGLAQMRETRLDPLAAVLRSPFDSATHLAVDRLLRDYLRPSSPTERTRCAQRAALERVAPECPERFGQGDQK